MQNKMINSKQAKHNNTNLVLSRAAKILERNGIENSLWEAEQLMASCLKTTRSGIYSEDLQIADCTLNKFNAAIESRLKQQPLQYIIGEWEFIGLKFIVDSRALIPRPETEILVETFIEKFKPLTKSSMYNFADIGTGCGAIAISIAKSLFCHVYASDISNDAIKLAKLNARFNKTCNVTFLKGDILKPFAKKELLFDGIIANLPYIPSEKMVDLPPDVYNYEPHVSLDGGTDGLELIKKLIKEAPFFLNTNGYLALEIGIGQSDILRRFIEKTNIHFDIEIVKDLNNIDRILLLRKDG